jgi:PST family polysaccharide transporter
MSGVRRGFVVLAFGQLVSIASGYGTHVLLARRLGPAEYGTYGVIIYVLSTVTLVLTAGVPEAIAKFAAEDPAHASAIFARGIRMQLAFAAVVAVGFAAVAPVLARLLNDVSLTRYLAMSALSVPPVAAYALVVGAFNGQRRFGLQSAVVGGNGALRFGLIMGFVPFFRVMGGVMGFIIAPLVVITLSLPLIMRRGQSASVDARMLWRFARPVIVFTVALNLLMSVDVFVVKALARVPEDIGYYTAAATIGRIPYFVFSTLGVVLLPVVSAAASREAAERVVRTALRWVFLASMLTSAVMVGLSTAALRLLYGEAYTWGAVPLSLLSVSGTFFTMFFIVAYALNGLGNPSLGMRLALGGVALEGVLTVFLVRVQGATGAATASCVVSIVSTATLLLAARPHLGAALHLRTIGRGVAAMFGTIAVAHLLPRGGPFAMFWAVPLALVNVALLVASREISLAELLPGRDGENLRP